MNLLGHFVTAQPLPPQAQLGAVLPDLVSLHRRRIRMHELVRAGEAHPGDAEVAQLLAGIAFHHHVDREFHVAPFFERSTARLQAALRGASGRPGLKRFFPAHLLTEMYLDGLLLNEQPGLARAFDAVLGLAPGGVAERLVAAHPASDPGAFGAFVERLLAQRFVDAYRSMGACFLRMNRILGRMGQRPLEVAEQEAVAATLAAHAAELRDGLRGFVQAMQMAAQPHPPVEPGSADRAAAGARLP
ncbi:MAG: hypothetical protein HY423_16330 [Candidatus Lambdaproteobacteria bacterium]|nr:hypothetical protein [Candidatus Lambdaproteobacteria bacterium]